MRKVFLIYLICIITNCYADEIKIKNILFKGNSKFTASQLKEIIVSREKTYYSAETANDDARRVITYYQDHGFLFTKVSYPEKIPINSSEIELIYTIKEQQISEINTLNYTGNSYFSDSKLNSFINPQNKNHLLTDIEIIKADILKLYISRGFLFSSVNLDSLSLNGERVDAWFKIDEGKQVKFKKAIFRGNKVSKENSLLKISNLKKDQILSKTIIDKAIQRLEEKEYLKSCEIIPLNEETLLFDVTEDRMTRLEGVLGFNNTKDSDKLIGYLNFEFMNLFGADKNLIFRWQSFQNKRNLIRMRYFDSGPERIPVAFNLGFERESVDSTYIKIITDTDIYSNIDDHQVGINLGINDINPGSKVLNRIEKNTQKKIGLFWNYNSYDYKNNPRSGISSAYKYTLFFLKTGGEGSNRFSNEFRLDFVKAVFKNTVFFTSFNFKNMQNKGLEYYDLYTVGGTFSVRGFQEDFFTGNRVFWLNNELRFLPDRDSRFFVFMDYAYIEDQRAEVKSVLKNIIGTGIGFRIPSRLGIIRMDYAIHYYESKWLHPMDGYVHLGLETLF